MADVLKNIADPYLTLLFTWFYAGGTWIIYSGLNTKIAERAQNMQQGETGSIGEILFNGGWAMCMPAILVMLADDLGFDSPFYMFTQVAADLVSGTSEDMWAGMAFISMLIWITIGYMSMATNYKGPTKIAHTILLLVFNQVIISFYGIVAGTT